MCTPNKEVDASGSKGKGVDMSESSDKGEDAAGSAQSSVGDKKRVFIDLSNEADSEEEDEGSNSNFPKLVAIKMEKED